MSASCQIPDEKKKKSVYIIPLAASVVGVLGLVIAIALFLLYKKRHRRGKNIKKQSYIASSLISNFTLVH